MVLYAGLADRERAGRLGWVLGCLCLVWFDYCYDTGALGFTCYIKYRRELN